MTTRLTKASVVVSMTTVPSRNGTLEPVLSAISHQFRRADEIRLYLTPGCQPVRFPGVRCIEVADKGPVTKLSAVADPTLPADTIVVTADDDIIYQPAWLQMLVASALRHPADAVGVSGWNVGGFFDDEAERVPSTKASFAWARYPDTCDVLEGCGGIAYRKEFFDADVLSPPPMYRYVDDVWISAYLARRGIVRRMAGWKMQAQQFPLGTSPGLSGRSDFVDLNRAAALAAWRDLPRHPHERPITAPAASDRRHQW